MTPLRCFLCLCLLAVSSFDAGMDDGNRREIVFPAGRVVLQPVNISDAQKLEIGCNSSGEELVCFLAREADLSLSIRREGVAEPLLRHSSSSLPLTGNCRSL